MGIGIFPQFYFDSFELLKWQKNSRRQKKCLRDTMILLFMSAFTECQSEVERLYSVPEAYSWPCQRSSMECFTKTIIAIIPVFHVLYFVKLISNFLKTCSNKILSIFWKHAYRKKQEFEELTHSLPKGFQKQDLLSTSFGVNKFSLMSQ